MKTKTMKLLKIEKAEAGPRGLGDGTVALGCHYEGARYHIWLTPATLDPGDLLYKNCLEDRKHPDYFNTRHLRISSMFAQELIASMLHAYKTKGLLAKFEVEEAKEEADRKAKNEASARLARMKEASEAMYAELVEIGKGLLGEPPESRTSWQKARLEHIGKIVKKIG